MKLESMRKNIKGITLIALVVTIIIMLILASITINFFIGDHGLFSRAKDAANKYKEAEANERNELDYLTDVVFDNAPQFIDDGTVIEGASNSMKIKTLAVDDDGDRLTYTLNFGETEELGQKFTVEKEEGEEVIFNITGLTRNITYYYKIEVTDGKKTTEGRLLNKKTIDNWLPKFEDEGSLIEVTEKTIKIKTMATDKDGDELTYILRWGKTKECENVEERKEREGAEVIFELKDLDIVTEYYWKVEVTDGKETVRGKEASTITKGEAPKFIEEGKGSVSNINTINITATATDSDTEILTYILNWGTSEDYENTETKSASKDQVVTFTKENLSYYTPYYWRIDVTDGITTIEGEKSSTKTYCRTTKCNGPFTKTCTNCGGLGVRWLSCAYI